MGTVSVQERELEAFQEIASGLEELNEAYETARSEIEARDRGYLLPDEDNRVKRLFRSYLSYRNELYRLVERHRNFDQYDDREQQQISFLLAFGSALLLYHYSSKLVETYRDVDVIRRKLNEPAPALGIESDTFDTINRSVTSFRNLSKLREAADYFEEHRDQLKHVTTERPEVFGELFDVVDQLHESVQTDLVSAIRDHVSRDMTYLRKSITDPLKRVRESIMSWFLVTAGDLWLERDSLPRIPHEHRNRFRELFEPGDLYLVRPERKTTSMVFPGYWSHSVLYLGPPSHLAESEVSELSQYQQHADRIDRVANDRHTVIESLAPGVVVNTIGRSMTVDHVVAFRPNIPDDERLRAIDESLRHVGKPYDFSFDFSRSDRLVCSELIYRAYHGKGSISFDPIERLGKPTYAADDVARYAGKHIGGPSPPLKFLAMSTRDSSSGEHLFLTGEEGKEKFFRTVTNEE